MNFSDVYIQDYGTTRPPISLGYNRAHVCRHWFRVFAPNSSYRSVQRQMIKGYLFDRYREGNDTRYETYGGTKWLWIGFQKKQDAMMFKMCFPKVTPPMPLYEKFDGTVYTL